MIKDFLCYSDCFVVGLNMVRIQWCKYCYEIMVFLILFLLPFQVSDHDGENKGTIVLPAVVRSHLFTLIS